MVPPSRVYILRASDPPAMYLGTTSSIVAHVHQYYSSLIQVLVIGIIEHLSELNLQNVGVGT